MKYIIPLLISLNLSAGDFWEPLFSDQSCYLTTSIEVEPLKDLRIEFATSREQTDKLDLVGSLKNTNLMAVSYIQLHSDKNYQLEKYRGPQEKILLQREGVFVFSKEETDRYFSIIKNGNVLNIELNNKNGSTKIKHSIKSMKESVAMYEACVESRK